MSLMGYVLLGMLALPALAQNLNAPVTPAHDFAPGQAWLNTAKPLTMAELQGKIVLLDFWTYCCINCMHVLPDLHKLELEHPELVVVGVHSAKFANEQDAENVRAAILRYDIQHPVVVDNDFVLWQQYGINAWPSFVLIGPDGLVQGMHAGEGVYAALKSKIAALAASHKKMGTLKTERLAFALEKDKTPASVLHYPGKLVADEANRRLFVSDAGHHRILIIGQDGKVQAAIGSGEKGSLDGNYNQAQFNNPQGMAYDAARQVLYVADTDNHLLRAIDLRTQQVKTILGTGQQAAYGAAGGTGRACALNSPWDVVLLQDKLYIAMAGAHQIWRMDVATQLAEVFAGSGREDITDGQLRQAALAQPSGICTDGQRLFFVDSETSALRMVDGDKVKTLIGKGLFDFGDVDGSYPSARLQHPIGIHYAEGKLWLADSYNHKIKVYDLGTGQLITFAGSGKRGYQDDFAAGAQLNEPNGLVWMQGLLYITDTNNHLIRVYDPMLSGRVQTLALRDLFRLQSEGARAAKADRKSYTGKVVTLPAKAVDQLTGMVEVHIAVPRGHHLNAEAPHAIAMQPDYGIHETQVQYQNTDSSLVRQLPLRLTEDVKALVFDVVVYYCKDGEEARCMIQQLRLMQPLLWQVGTKHPLRVSYRLE